MGLGKLASRVATGIATGGVSEQMRVGKSILGGNGPSYEAQPIDPQLEQLANQQKQRATDFRANMGNMQAQQFGQAEEGARQNLSQNIYANKAGYNRRGLLYSGLKSGGEVDAQTQSAKNLAQQKSDISGSLENQAQGLESQALGSSVDMARLRSDNINAQQQFDMQKQQQRNQALGGLLGTGGKIAGGYLGGF